MVTVDGAGLLHASTTTARGNRGNSRGGGNKGKDLPACLRRRTCPPYTAVTEAPEASPVADPHAAASATVVARLATAWPSSWLRPPPTPSCAS